jgi:hypothetical protein
MDGISSALANKEVCGESEEKVKAVDGTNPI